MELRKRVKLNKLRHKLGLSPDAPAEGRGSSNMMLRTARSYATQEEEGGRQASLFGGWRSGSGSSAQSRGSWRRWVSMAAGLLLAGLLALTQAWCVNAIHENLLWFSQLMVGVLTCALDCPDTFILH